MRRSRANFSDFDGGGVSLSSSWKTTTRVTEMACQTGAELYEHQDNETLAGQHSEVEYYEVAFDKGDASVLNLIDFLRKSNRRRSREELRGLIEGGYVKVQDTVVQDPRQPLGENEFIEVVVSKKDMAVQTTPPSVAEGVLGGASSFASEAKGGDDAGNGDKGSGGGKAGDDDDDDDYGYDDDFDNMADSKDDGDAVNKSRGSKDADNGSSALASFLSRSAQLIEIELTNNKSSHAFDGFDTSGGPDGTSEVSTWKTLSVDLEKHRVTYPDWTQARFHTGRVTEARLTRNKERTYCIAFDDDGTVLPDVREEYVRVINPESVVHPHAYFEAQKAKTLRNGVRVLVRTTIKVRGGRKESRHVPGRVLKMAKSGLMDVEIEGGTILDNVPRDEVLLGLEEGMQVEAKRPVRQELHCTGVAWNATGNTVAACYGRADLEGWCDLPGAVCLWSVFGPTFDATSPDLVLDHPSCLTRICCHPEQPALIAAGSYNGEVIVWDTSSASPEEPVGVSPTVDFCHKEPVLDVSWAYDAHAQQWTLLSVGADGKLLNWDISNKLRHPVKGSLLAKRGTLGKSSRKEFPLAYGGTAVALSGGAWSIAGSSLSRRPQWVLVGQEGGAVVRAQAKQALVLHGKRISRDDIKAVMRSGGDLFSPLRGGVNASSDGEGFRHTQHIGPVTSIDGSPFHRSLFLTSGQDGSIRLYHALEMAPLFQWEPTPPPGTAGISGAFGAMTAARFSPVRPCVLAAASSDGFVYVFDLSKTTAAPVATLEALTMDGASSARPVLTDVSFNAKQRDLLAACDTSGRVHTWRLGWELSNRQMADQEVLERLGSLTSTKENE